MATHSSVLAWRIPGMVEPGGLPFMGLHRVRTQLTRLSSSSSMEASDSELGLAARVLHYLLCSSHLNLKTICLKRFTCLSAQKTLRGCVL